MIQAKLNSFGLGWAELIGLITSFLFITGWCYAYAYFDIGLNADWLINLLTTKDLLFNNLRLGVCLIMAFLYFGLEWQENKIYDHKKLFWRANIILAVLVFFWWIRDGISAIWEAVTYLIAFNAIYFIIYHELMLKFIGSLLIFVVIPCINGFIAYDRKIKSDLPVVEIMDETKKWFLFDTYSDQAVLIDSTKKEKNIRIVPISDLVNIKVK